MKKQSKSTRKPLYKSLGLTGLVLCGLCCVLPFISVAIGIGSVTAIAFYLEQVAIVALGMAGIFFAYHWYQKRQAKRKCENSCETDCTCKPDNQTQL